MVVSKPRKRPSAENVYFNPAGLGVNLIDPPRLPLAELRAQNARGRETHRCQNYISFLPCMHLVRLLRAVLWNVPAGTLKKRHEAHVFTRGPEPTQPSHRNCGLSSTGNPAAGAESHERSERRACGSSAQRHTILAVGGAIFT